MSRRRKEPFYLVVIDDGKKVLSVEGPMMNDHPWNEKIIESRKAGRDLRCFSIWPKSESDREKQIADFCSKHGYTKAAASIIEAPADIAHIYQGQLPDYAKDADRGRVVEAHCDRCRSTRWHEMDRQYPGRDALRGAQVLSMKAKCLFCGSETKDPYNWYRPGRERTS